MKRIILNLLLCLILFFSLNAQPITITEKTTGMEKFPGYFNFYWDEATGKIWLEIDKFNTEFLYVNSLPAGLGSNDVGLDRNRLGSTKIVKFQKFGPKVLLIQSNYDYRAMSDNPFERRAVADAFAKSVTWGFKIEAGENNRVLVDATSFLLNDALDVVRSLKRTKQGDYKLDLMKSAIYLKNTKNFSFNTEYESILTFSGKNPGNFVREVTPDPSSITIRQHHSFIQLPDGNYKPRVYDSRSSFGSISYMDFAVSIDQPIVRRYIRRHRLQKKDPNAKISEPVKPIVYYVDRGVPEPIRLALIEGVSWWNQAFEAIGYKNAFQVKLLPEHADPLDIRYNVINWIHRSSRGWSYGSSVTDPRTGEILKGHVALGSLRVRQDYLIAQGLIGNFEADKNNAPELAEMALARIRQLSCHEVGHTLGLMHNYASSANERASVMDYPHPLIKIKNDSSLDLSDAYTKGIGEWDKVAIAYGYQDFPDGVDEQKELKAILNKALSGGLYFLTDQDARPPGSAHPLAHLWDNGKHPVDELERVMKIRSIALKNFSEKRIPIGTSMASLEEVIVPIYLFHRYQIEAAAKVLGGVYYNHSIRGEGQNIHEIVKPGEQRQALDVLLKTIQSKNLAIDEKILKLIPPRPPGYRQSQELFSGHTGLTFDPLASAENVANMTISLLLNPERAARLVEHHSLNKDFLSLDEVVDRLILTTWKSDPQSGYDGEIQRVVNQVVLNHLMKLAADKNAMPQVCAVVGLKIDDLKNWLGKHIKRAKDNNQKAHYFQAKSIIERFQNDPDNFHLPEPLPIPNGAPIGEI